MKVNNSAEISITVLTKNSQKYLEKVLSSVVWANEVIVYDTGSSDDTFEIASRFSNVRIIRGSFQGFGPTHNTASSLAKNAWVFSLDSDEIVSGELANRLKFFQPEKGAVYSMPRRNYYNGKWIRWCGWHPDRQIRLYNREETRFTDAQVHESIISEGMRVVALEEPLIHYSYDRHSDFLAKMQSYSDLFAAQNAGKKRSSLFKALMHSFFAFFKSYFLKRGVMGGYEGFVISVYNANTAFYKYLKLLEINAKRLENIKGK